VIRYALVCDQGHGFESWFRGSAAYDEAAAAGHLSCPSCGSPRVEKAVMAPHVAGERASEAPRVNLVSPQEEELRGKLKALRAHLTENADYVGQGFAEEARRIHLGEVERRSIYGEASLGEAKTLVEDGVEIMPLPALPDERN